MLLLTKPFYKGIVSTSGHTEEFAHDRYRVLVPVTIDNGILYLCPHFLSMDCRKSRNNLFSILSRFTSVSMFCLGGCPSFLGRPFGFDSACGHLKVDCLLLYRVTHHLTCCFVKPSSSAISCRVMPASRIAIISGSLAFTFVQLRLLINTPPSVVIILHLGVFCLLSVFTGSVQIQHTALPDRRGAVHLT